MVTTRSPGPWVRIAFAMFAVGWGANQFSPMLIVYRHELGLTAGAVAGLFLVYALTLIPGALVGGPRSEEHTSELQSRRDLVCRLLLEKKKKTKYCIYIVRKYKKNEI